MAERKVITNNIQWMRFFTLPIIFGGAMWLISSPQSWDYGLLTMIIGGVIYFALFHVRRLHFDKSALYIIRGKNQTKVPFTTIESIRRSKVRVNNQTLWVLKYNDTTAKLRTIRFVDTWFDGRDSNFQQAVKAANPDVTIRFSAHFDY